MFEVDQKTQGDAADGLRAADAERQLLQPAGAQRPQLPVGRSADDVEGSPGQASTCSSSASTCSTPASTATTSASELDVRRLDGSLAERTTYSPVLTHPDVSGTEFAVFAQDRWRVNDRLMFELGLRADRDDVVEQVNYSPRAGVAVSACCPRAAASCAAASASSRSARRSPSARSRSTKCRPSRASRPTARPLGAAGHLRARHRRAEDAGEHRPDRRVGSAVRPPLLLQGGLPAPQRIARGYSSIRIRASGVLTLSSTGASKYWEFETTGRYLASEHRDLTVSYVRSHSTRDLNDYDQFFGNFRNPIIRPNENSLSPTDVPESHDRARHDRPAGQVGVHAALRVAHRVSLVGGQRVPGLRRVRETNPAGCRVSARSTSRSRGR